MPVGCCLPLRRPRQPLLFLLLFIIAIIIAIFSPCVDAQYTFVQSMSLTEGPAVQVWEQFRTVNYYGADNFAVSLAYEAPSNSQSRGLFRIDNVFGSLFRSSRIFVIGCSVNWYATTGRDNQNITVVPLTSAFDATSVTWNTQPSFVPSAAVTGFLCRDSNAYCSSDLTPLCSQWAADPASNFGVVMLPTTSKDVILSTGAAASDAQWPQFTLVLNPFIISSVNLSSATVPRFESGVLLVDLYKAPGIGRNIVFNVVTSNSAVAAPLPGYAVVNVWNRIVQVQVLIDARSVGTASFTIVVAGGSAAADYGPSYVPFVLSVTAPTFCPAGLYGPNCTACPVCGLHESCDDGLTGSGQCVCAMGWDGTLCSACASGYFGADCSGICPSCNNYSGCSQGIQGTGQCICSVANADPTAACMSCKPGFFGWPGCGTFCVASATCHGHGTCDSRTGACICSSSYGGAFCDVSLLPAALPVASTAAVAGAAAAAAAAGGPAFLILLSAVQTIVRLGFLNVQYPLWYIEFVQGFSSLMLGFQVPGFGPVYGWLMANQASWSESDPNLQIYEVQSVGTYSGTFAMTVVSLLVIVAAWFVAMHAAWFSLLIAARVWLRLTGRMLHALVILSARSRMYVFFRGILLSALLEFGFPLYIACFIQAMFTNGSVGAGFMTLFATLLLIAHLLFVFGVMCRYRSVIEHRTRNEEELRFADHWDKAYSDLQHGCEWTRGANVAIQLVEAILVLLGAAPSIRLEADVQLGIILPASVLRAFFVVWKRPNAGTKEKLASALVFVCDSVELCLVARVAGNSRQDDVMSQTMLAVAMIQMAKMLAVLFIIVAYLCLSFVKLLQKIFGTLVSGTAPSLDEKDVISSDHHEVLTKDHLAMGMDAGVQMKQPSSGQQQPEEQREDSGRDSMTPDSDGMGLFNPLIPMLPLNPGQFVGRKAGRPGDGQEGVRDGSGGSGDNDDDETEVVKVRVLVDEAPASNLRPPANTGPLATDTRAAITASPANGSGDAAVVIPLDPPPFAQMLPTVPYVAGAVDPLPTAGQRAPSWRRLPALLVPPSLPRVLMPLRVLENVSHRSLVPSSSLANSLRRPSARVGYGASAERQAASTDTAALQESRFRRILRWMQGAKPPSKAPSSEPGMLQVGSRRPVDPVAGNPLLPPVPSPRTWS